VVAVVGKIAAATQSESGNIDEVDRAMTEMDAVTQQNAALVEEATAKSLSFQDEAARLNQVVARFTIAEEPQAVVAQPAQRSSPAPEAKPVPIKRRLARAAAGGHAANWKEF